MTVLGSWMMLGLPIAAALGFSSLDFSYGRENLSSLPTHLGFFPHLAEPNPDCCLFMIN